MKKDENITSDGKRVLENVATKKRDRVITKGRDRDIVAIPASTGMTECRFMLFAT